MVKHLIWIFAGVLLTAAVAELILRQTTGRACLRELATAAAIALISAELAMVPLLLLRTSSAIVAFQAAFGGTVIHMFLSFALGATAHAMHLVGDRRLFLFLLLGFYSFSLMFVVTAMIKIFRRSAAQQPQVAGDARAKTS